MKKSIVEIYGLAVCFATIVCFVISLGIGIYDIVEIMNPEFTMKYYAYDKHQTNDAFWKGKYSRDKKKPRPSEEELTKQREKSFQHEIKKEQRNAFQSLTQILIILVINALVFIIHWRIARRARESNVNNT